MKSRLRCVLLIDDDNDSNFFHKRLLSKMDCAELVHITNNGPDALEFLKHVENGKHPQPDIIFLDINMPGMNGWQFLEAYNDLGDDLKGKVFLVMLTSSLNPDDRERALNYNFVKGFENKFMTQDSIKKMLVKNFKELF